MAFKRALLLLVCSIALEARVVELSITNQVQSYPELRASLLSDWREFSKNKSALRFSDVEKAPRGTKNLIQDSVCLQTEDGSIEIDPKKKLEDSKSPWSCSGLSKHPGEGLLSSEIPNWPMPAFAPEVYLLGDLHGDFETTVSLLSAVGLINETGGWTGGKHWLVQLGDIVDRGDSSYLIYMLFRRLRKEASEQGGAVLQLMGNHELLNVVGDFRYIDFDESEAYEGGAKGRKKMWNMRKGPMARELAESYHAAIRLGDVMLVHAGLHEERYTNMTFDQLKMAVLGELYKSAEGGEGLGGKSMFDMIAFDASGPFWTRQLGEGTEWACELLRETLLAKGARHLVVGHRVTETGEVTLKCNGGLVMTDVAASRWVRRGRANPVITRVVTTRRIREDVLSDDKSGETETQIRYKRIWRMLAFRAIVEETNVVSTLVKDTKLLSENLCYRAKGEESSRMWTQTVCAEAVENPHIFQAVKSQGQKPPAPISREHLLLVCSGGLTVVMCVLLCVMIFYKRSRANRSFRRGANSASNEAQSLKSS